MALRKKKSIQDSPLNPFVSTLHIGAGSVSMMIATRADDGTITPVDVFEKPAPLAHDIFSQGKISQKTTEQIVDIIRTYQEALSELGADPYVMTRAVASNILSEAKNHEAFMNRIRIACGLPISIIDDGEMTRLIYLKTRRRLEHLPAMQKNNTLVVHVGPGNTRALLFQEGLITRYTSYRMGSHRTREQVEASHTEGSNSLRLIRDLTLSHVVQLKHDYNDVNISGLVVIGYEIQSVSRYISKSQKAFPIKNLREFIQRVSRSSQLEVVKSYQLDYQTAEALLPALEINCAIAETLKLQEVNIPKSEYEYGLLSDLFISQGSMDQFENEVVRSAQILASRYLTDSSHGEHVSNLCLHLFNSLQEIHHLDHHDALLLKVAAILHEVGTYINAREHQKHSEYIIMNSEIFGLDRIDVTFIALISRYHRHESPQPSDASYATLSTNDRIRVLKLSAILRVADALERTHAQRVREIKIRISANTVHISLPSLQDSSVERMAMESKSDLFEQVFGMNIVIEN